MKHYLFNDINELIGISQEAFNKLGLTADQQWTLPEIMTIKNKIDESSVLKAILWEGKTIEGTQDFVDFMNNKRFFAFKNKQEVRYVVIPSHKGKTLSVFSKYLLSIAISYVQYKSAEPEKSEECYKEFLSRLDNLTMQIAKQFLSKKFKDNYRFKFTGFNSVALTGHLSPDGVAIPENIAKALGVEIGDLCIVKRDPLQNIFITLRVEQFHQEPIVRLHPQTFLLGDGDFDGDQVAVIPVKYMLEENKKFIGNKAEAIIHELEELIPSKIMNNARFDVLTREYQEPFREVTEPVKTHSEILHASKKSMKFTKGGEITEESYLDNHVENVRNMITVKEGTAVAGSFCNWIMECARNYGLDMITARGLSNRVQRVALDSKHTTGIDNYTELEWYKVATLRTKRVKWTSVDEIEHVLNEYINGGNNEVKEDEELSIIDNAL